jgi:antitoxin (DNA-binding transcriptional repressor) of toxin-antitoxin stability system
MTVRITEAELAREVRAVLAKVQAGVEVIVEQEHRPVAVIRLPQGPGRKINDRQRCPSGHRRPA